MVEALETDWRLNLGVVMTWEEMTERYKDAWIAEHVMGWKWVKGMNVGGAILMPPAIASTYIPSAILTEPPQGWRESWRLDLPYFSSDIAAAFSMEDKIKERGLHMEYAIALVRLGSKPFNQTMAFDSIHASAEQRCRAAYEVFNSL